MDNGNGILIRMGKIAAAIFGIGLLMFTVNAAVFATKDTVNLKIETEKDKRKQLRLDVTISLSNIDKTLSLIQLDQKYIKDEMKKQSRQMRSIERHVNP